MNTCPAEAKGTIGQTAHRGVGDPRLIRIELTQHAHVSPADDQVTIRQGLDVSHLGGQDRAGMEVLCPQLDPPVSPVQLELDAPRLLRFGPREAVKRIIEQRDHSVGDLLRIVLPGPARRALDLEVAAATTHAPHHVATTTVDLVQRPSVATGDPRSSRRWPSTRHRPEPRTQLGLGSPYGTQCNQQSGAVIDKQHRDTCPDDALRHGWRRILAGGLVVRSMFDVQARFHRGGELPEDALASIAGYYRRVTTTARPMSRLVGAVMLATIGAIIAQSGAEIDRNGWGGFRSSWLARRSSSRRSARCPPRCDSAPGPTRLGSRANLRNRSAAITSSAPPRSSPLSHSRLSFARRRVCRSCVT